jgi:hypothetical protein
MAKLNWQKLNIQSKVQSINERTATPSYLNFDDNNLWALHGKYYGIHIGKLPTDYLFWISDNSTSGKYKSIAEGEIYRRYRELTNTEG